ncbi:MAG: alpha/beta hydrolase [Clostridia bacterium]|nr:alpha/beta hydrolase [Clostridia bacterium]
MDITLNTIDVGEGKPLVLLHGNGESTEYFAQQIPYFQASRRVIAVDTRGHGLSPRGTAPFTLTQFAEDLRKMLDQKGLEKVDLLGFSDGGNIAMLFALKYPERVDRLILNGANLRPSGVKLAVQLPIVLGYGIVALMAKFSRKAAVKKEVLGLMVHEPHIAPGDLAGLTCPTLVIVGSNDMIRHGHSKKIAAAIPNAAFVTLHGSHFIAAEASVEFNRVVEKFLAENDNSAQS